jgi:hypothetical protein
MIMKRILAIVGVLAIVATVVQAAWTQPTDDQIKAAANDPSKLPALLQGANAQQAASVIVAVLQEAATTTPPAGMTRQALVTQITTLGLQGQSQQNIMAIVREVGTRMGNLAPISSAVAAISGFVQTALVALPQAGTGVAAVYTANFNQAVRASAPPGEPVDNLLLPPVTTNYRGT